MAIVNDQGLVLFSPSRLALLICPLRGKSLLDEPKSEPSVAARVGRAAHRVLATLARQGWPDDAFTIIPALTRGAIESEWIPRIDERDRYEREALALIDILREFACSWDPPARTKPYVEAWAELEHVPSHLRIAGRLDLLYPPADRDRGWAEVLDFKTGSQPTVTVGDDAQVPLTIVAQAAICRAKLGLRCPVRVRNVYIRNGRPGEQIWGVDQQALVAGWKKIRALAADILASRWPAVPGEYCERCKVGDDCEWGLRAVDAAELGLVDDLENE